MQKSKLYLLGSLVAVLSLLAAALAVMGHLAPQAGQYAPAAAADPDREVPALSVAASSNWHAAPVSGSAAQVGWANIKVNPDSSSNQQNEPYAAVDPHNAQHLVVGANSWSNSGQFEVYAYTSFDGGQTWSSSQPYINRNASRLNAADATVTFGKDGTVYFGFVAFNPAAGAVAVSRSLDGGLTWSSQSWATSFTGSADKPAIAVNGSTVYVYYQGQGLQSTVSVNGGSSWSAPVTLDANGHNAAPSVDSLGNVNVFYVTNSSLNLARLATGTILAGYRITTVSNIVALQARPAQYRASIYPAAASDSKGVMYVAWADGRNAGHGNDILLSRSKDGGSTWTAPQTVNSDNSSADQLMPAVTVGADNVATVAWLDNRNDSANINYDVYMARGDNGFSSNTRVTNVASNQNNDPMLQGTMIGDYFAIAAGAGVVHPFWTDTRNNNEDIYTAPVTTSTK